MLEVCQSKTNQSCLYFLALPLSAPQSCSNQAAQKRQQLSSNAANRSLGTCTRRALGADQEAKSGLITSSTSVFINSSTWLLQATVSIDHMHTTCRTVKTLVCSGVFGMPARILLPEGALPACAGGWWGDSSQRSEWHYCCFIMFNSKGVSSRIQNCRTLKHYYYIFSLNCFFSALSRVYLSLLEDVPCRMETVSNNIFFPLLQM